MDRRKFLVRAGGAAVGLGLAVPAVVMLISPTLDGDDGPFWARVGPVGPFPIDQTTPAIVEVDRDDWSPALRKRLLYIRRRSADEFVVFSRNCTDLSCPVEWDGGSRTFLCPCHGGIFDRDGVPMAGPPSKPLFRYAHRIEDGHLEVDLNSVPPFA
jgi:menaquinol-cytochrome c reductase iron-sulfur subunit